MSTSIGNAYAYITDVAPPTERPTYIGYITAVTSLCLIVGPMIGGGMAVFGVRLPFYGATLFALISACLTFAFIVEVN
jgi:MFS family permease